MSILEHGIEVIHEQGPCLVVCKPAGLSTQAPPGIDSLETRIKAFLKQRDEKPGGVYLGVPHRLDRPVSGVMVFAKHVRAARRLSEQFERRTVEKTYWGCVSGEIEPASGRLRDMLRKIPGRAHVEVAPDHDDAREAILSYRTLETTRFGSWLEITLETGRTHQIRVQLASRGHPILGDSQYGGEVPFGRQTDDPRQRGIALHGYRLIFDHPMTRERQTHIAPPPEDWRVLDLPEMDR